MYINETSDKLLKSVIDEARATFPERFAGKSSQEIVNEIAAVVRRAERKGVTNENQT